MTESRPEKLPITATLEDLDTNNDEGVNGMVVVDDDGADDDNQSIASEIQSHGDEDEPQVFFTCFDESNVEQAIEVTEAPPLAEPTPPCIKSKKLVMLITLYCSDRETMPRQKRAISMLADCNPHLNHNYKPTSGGDDHGSNSGGSGGGIAPVIIDGSDPKHREKRNELFDLAGMKRVYPLFFIEEYEDDHPVNMTFLGTFETIEKLKENDKLKYILD
jgi:hypothetical protein